MKTKIAVFLGLLALAHAAYTVSASPPVAGNGNPVAAKKPDQPLAPAEPAPAPSRRLGIAESAGLPERFASYFEGNARRRFYLQTDKPMYRPGETIWFKSWILKARTLGGADNTQAVVELVSPKGAVVMKKRLHVAGGSGSGDFSLPPDAQGGEYTLRTDADDGTRIERNVIVSAYEPPRIKKTLEFVKKAYGAGDLVSATVEVKRPTGEALGNKEVVAVATVDGVELPRMHVTTAADGGALVKFSLPKMLGAGDGLLTILVEEGGVTESISKTIPILQHKLALAFFPEGGKMVAGLPARLYFEAKTPLGKPADVEGRLVDDLGNVVAKFATVKNGLGRAAFTPATGRSYSAEIIRPAGVAEHYALPLAEASGCVMRAYDDFDSREKALRVGVLCSEEQKVIVAATVKERWLDAGSVTAGSKVPGVIYLSGNDPELQNAAGIARITVFDQKLNPQAERLVFRNRRARLQVQVETDKKTYAPRDQVALTITTRSPSGKPVPAELGLSVVDDTVLSFADDKGGNLLSKLLLEPELPGKVEEPNFYLDLSEAKSAEALDLLMGVRGYRRFDWQPVLSVVPPPSSIPVLRPRNERNVQRVEIVGSAVKRVDAETPSPIQIIVAQDLVRQGVNPVAAMIAPAPQMFARAVPMAAPVAAPAPPEVVADRPVLQLADARAARRVVAEPTPVMKVDPDFNRAAARAGAMLALPPPMEWAPVRVFPVPSFQPDYAGPRDDYRETVYWAPSIQTDANGKASVKFVLSDAVTSFRVSSEGVGGGVTGRDETVFKSSLPFSLSAKLPLEVSAGDRPLIPVTLTNDSDRPQNVALNADFGALMSATGGTRGNETLAPGQSKSLFISLDVNDARGISQAHLVATAAGLRDEVVRNIPVAPLGFPQLIEKSGLIKGEITQQVDLGNARPGSIEASVRVYVSSLSTMISGLEGMLREPSGCFEQTSSTNYPNVMIMQYMRQHDVADTGLLERTDKLLDSGYKHLSGFESPTKGYEWFGRNPGHEALTAYGLLEFADMQGVYNAVDPAMLTRTAAWLKSRRDGKGGYLRDAAALDSFGRAGPAVTDAYITWALASAGETGLDEELARSAKMAETTNDAYQLALAAGALLQRPQGSPPSKAGLAAAARLAKMQSPSGAWINAEESITRSGGLNLQIETTSLAILALLQADGYLEQARLGVAWLQNNRGGFGQWGATQATVLALKAVSAFDTATRVAPTPGTVSLLIDGVTVAQQSYATGQREPLVFAGLEQQLPPGKHSITIKSGNDNALPYSIAVEYRSTEPASSSAAVTGLSTTLVKTEVKMGETVRLNATLTNRTQSGQPMTLVRIGIPGGLTFQNWQLKEMREKGKIAFFETRPREVILYLDDLKPGEVKQLPIDLVASVPGAYTGPASSAYLYYNDTDKDWAAPLTVKIVP